MNIHLVSLKMRNQKTCLSLLAVFLFFSLFTNVTSKESKPNQPVALPTVIVVGGGIAGMSAARHLMQNGNYNVRVFEGRGDRYGGRIWTNRKAVKARGAEVELGAMYLNTQAKNNPLLQLAEEFELPTTTAGSMKRLFLPDKNLELAGSNVTDLYRDILKVIGRAIRRVKESGTDSSVKSAVLEELETNFESKYDRDVFESILQTFPVILLEDFSALQYNMDIDYGWSTVVLDGVDTLLDRIVSGNGTDSPVKIDLNRVVKQVKVDSFRHKAVVRTTDRKQTIADKVIMAVPVGMYKTKSLVFEPYLPRTWYGAVKELGLGFSNKIIVGFEEAFWPLEDGSYTVASTKATNGFLQTWTNLYPLSKKPYLMGTIFGQAAIDVEDMSDQQVKEKAKEILSEMFGRETVERYNMTVFMRSRWLGDHLTKGSFSYPRTGSNDTLWEILRKPSCPYIYFAGAHTQTSDHVETLHGAYNSGIQAADQILQGTCEKELEEKKKTKKEKEKKKKHQKENKELDKKQAKKEKSGKEKVKKASKLKDEL